MASTVEILRSKSANLKNAIGQFISELKNTNNEIGAQIEANENAVVQANVSIEQLHKDNEELAVLRAENETFISKVEEILGE